MLEYWLNLAGPDLSLFGQAQLVKAWPNLYLFHVRELYKVREGESVLAWLVGVVAPLGQLRVWLFV